MNAWLIAILMAVTLASARCTPVHQATPGRAECPVTVPNGNAPPGKESADYFHGNGSIFTALPEYGIERAVRDRSGLGGSEKLIFYRLPIGEELVVSVAPFGDEQVGEPAKVRPSIGQEELLYQVFGVWYPYEGCWEIIAYTSKSSLTLVFNVIFVRGYEATPAT